MEDNETTFDQFYERIQKTTDALKTAKPEDFDGKDNVEVVIADKYKFTGVSYVQDFGLPNFFFHVTAAYAILRKEGAPVGKLDFLGAR
ncbi:hypothetical protein LTR37_009963 [Vermiconidia calcicola]|uniref:Uncharacterized protein n=1 Tax=Vermiconidia calcicola TaxID=1690605 RepID=A0ACC3N971_9PEZI|nr:hypothetical protein LTR37_009963 [Vermiconidia calcicola]